MRKIISLAMWSGIFAFAPIGFVCCRNSKVASFLCILALFIVYMNITHPLSKEPIGTGLLYMAIMIIATVSLFISDYAPANAFFGSLFGVAIGGLAGMFLAKQEGGYSMPLTTSLGFLVGMSGGVLTGHADIFLPFLTIVLICSFGISELINFEFPKFYSD